MSLRRLAIEINPITQPMAQQIGRINGVALGQGVNRTRPGVGAGTEAVDQQERLTLALVVVANLGAVDVGKRDFHQPLRATWKGMR